MNSHIEREHQSNALEKPTNNNNNTIIGNVNNKYIPPEKQRPDKNSSFLYENHRYVIIGPSNFDKTYYELNILEKINNKRPIHIVPQSPNQ